MPEQADDQQTQTDDDPSAACPHTVHKASFSFDHHDLPIIILILHASISPAESLWKTPQVQAAGALPNVSVTREK